MRQSVAAFKYAVMRAGACVPLIGLALSAAVAQAQGPASQSAASQGPASQGSATQGTADSDPALQPFHSMINNICDKCHNTTDWAGGFAFDTLDLSHPGQEPEVWEKAVIKLTGRLMPPAGQKQPSQAVVDQFIKYLQTDLDASAKDRGIGHVPLERLSREEFAASVKGLLGVDVDPKQVLPTEIEVDGFSNIARALTVSPTFMDQYLLAVRHIAETAVGEPLPKMETYFSGGGGGGGGQAGLGDPNQYTHKDGFPLGTRGGVSFTHVFPADGQYRFSFHDGDSLDAGLYPRGMETRATMVVLIDDQEVARKEIGGPADLTLADRDGPKGRVAITAEVSNIPVEIKAGAHRVTVTFVQRSWAESNEPTGAGRTFGIGMPIIRDGIQIQGPYSPAGLSLSASRAKIFICEPKSAAEERPCAERIARHLATQAFRRPVTDSDLNTLMKFYDDGRSQPGGFNSGVTELITAILASPDFMYRALSAPTVPGQSLALTDLELASRLSFLIWNQGPDQQLLTLAEKKQLHDPKVLDAQVARMLKDSRAESLVHDFAFSWFNFGTLDQVEPLDRSYNAAMTKNFETEARLFLSSVLLQNRSVNDLITADWTFVNDTLARQYGIPDVLGPQFRRVTLKDQNRWGLLGKGAFQLRTSYADRTSPVLRGEYVLDRLMGTPPHPPPSGVKMDLSFHEGEPPTTVRERLEAHRRNPTCNACHGLIDPLGLVLENFDVTGRWRTADPETKVHIDPTTQLANGMLLRTPQDLRHWLTRQPDLFPTVVTKRLMMYALNRELEYYDMPVVRKIVRDAAPSNYTFAALITGVVNSDEFQRQGAPPQQKGPQPPTKVASTLGGSKDATQQRQE
jgi:Protein of unknown function (DUF1592)/Protein of unknown function (DUF1588)/Protein of unknown function (DUF1585)/Protein of unknown function (DUF1595)/Protein of unknown function (DUF1587)